MFRSLKTDTDPQVSVTVNGQVVEVPLGQTVWSALALSGQTSTRKAALSGQDRSAYCAMGVCFECLVEIDGQSNQQACLRQVADGMHISTQVITENTKADL
ncbi:(2Fe-2S)-binding protein [Halocynthiibacter styelae]|uniref:(2Fe-2S)-binding protein n=1 Tax=Halocynthiibacter styelae TaxID=2761955 RepID=A0A8J7J1A6_9RHOB|nr:(2Fe-2S)-binding protein [Paenihalocynthiibacter styelae]MBI1495424.1 (2Fe-2S)-binding protein [Paenihalocynthiibacter styelae]